MELLTSCRAIPKPRLALIVLVATSCFVLSVLAFWLAYWLFFIRPDLNVLSIWIAPSPSFASTPELFYQKQDARIFGTEVMRKPENPAQVVHLIREFLKSKGQRPAIVYLSIPAVALPLSPSAGNSLEEANRLTIDPAVLDVAGATGPAAAGLNLQDVLDEFRQRPWQKKLLILDTGRISSNRDMGVFANDFVFRLKRDLDKNTVENFAVLCSLAPGQFSWSSDADRRSVFAHFVADGMNRARDVQELVIYVKRGVYQWVKTHRGAIQTPIFWADSGVNFLLPKPTAEMGLVQLGSPTSQSNDSPWKKQEAQDLWKRLVACYLKSDRLADEKPHRYAPFAWREYQETVLRAERLYRAGLFSEGGDAIKNVDALEQELKNPFFTLPKDGYPSLEMGLRIASDSGFHPEWEADREWEHALAWPTALTAPVAPDKSKPGDAAKKQGGGAISSEISGQGNDGAAAKGTASVPEILGLIVKGKNPWVSFVEGQFIDWAIEWTRLHPNPSFLSERHQAEVFCDTLKVRRFAEKAASASWQTGPWSEALLQAGDEPRRQAQDELFLGDQHHDAVTQHLQEAEIAYERAIKYGRALDLIEQIRVEWPYLAEWKIRRTATLGQREVIRTAELITSFTGKVLKLDSRVDPWSTRESPTDARIADFEREYEAVRQAFEQVKDEFKSALNAQSTSSSWREIDDLLRVPMIPSQVRKQLVETAVARSLDDALQPGLKAPRAVISKSKSSGVKQADSKAELQPADDKLEVQKAVAKADVQQAGGKDETERLGSSSESPDSPRDTASMNSMPDLDEGPEPEVVADEAFWAQANGMALLEWSLLAIANVQEILPVGAMTRGVNRPLDQLHEEITKASQIDCKLDPAKAYEYHSDRISPKLRNLWSRLIETCMSRSDGLGEIEEQWDENHRNRILLQRALIAMPRPQVDEVDMRVRIKNPHFAKLSQDLAVFHLRALLLRHARRLVDDLDSNRASRFVKLAEGLGKENSEMLKVRHSVESLRAASIKMSGSKIVLDGDTHQKEMQVLVEPDRMVPRGRAVISFDLSPIKGLQISRKATQAAGATAAFETGVQVNPEESPSSISYIVQRGIDVDEREGVVLNRERAEKSLAPSLFYRGHIYRTTEPIKIVLEPLKDVVYVTLHQDRQSLKRGFRDQFRNHPDDGYMHYNEDLAYEITVRNLKPDSQAVFVETKLEQDAQSDRHETVALKGKEARVVFRDRVRGVDLEKLGRKVLKSREVDLGRPRELEVTVWDSPARLRRLTTRRIRFTHLQVDAYAAMVNVYYQNEVVYLIVRHLGTDPGKGYIDNVSARVEGMSQPATVDGDALGEDCKIGKDDFYVFWFGVDPKTPKVRWSVKVGMKSDAFGASLTINSAANEKEKEKEKGKEEKDTQAPKL